MIDSEIPATAVAATPAKKKKISMGQAISVGIVAALLLIIGTTGYFYYHIRQQLKQISSEQGQQDLAKKEIQEVSNNLSKLTILPDETPVIATILDAPYLSTQSAFYAKAQNGDKLVVYPKAQKAYIYSPSRNLIVNDGPLILSKGQAEPIKLEIRNGTSTAGAANRLKSKIDGNGVEVIAVDDAATKDYTQTLVIALNAAVPSEQLNAIAENVKGRVSTTLPSNEAASQADVLIIVGGVVPAASPSPAAVQ